MKKQITKDKWIWMPHPAHFICAQDCKFFMATKIGKYIVSTVGEYFPDAPIREIYAKSRGIAVVGMGDARRADYMTKIGFEDIGLDRKYETMVFKARKSIANDKTGERVCCPYRIESGQDLDFAAYNEAKDAYDGHIKMCLKWSKK